MSNEEKRIIVYQYNDQIGEFEELIIAPETELLDLLDDDRILLFVEPKHFRMVLWQGYNTTTRMKFSAAKKLVQIRNKFDKENNYDIIFVDQGYENPVFRLKSDLIEEKDGPAILEMISRQKVILLLEKAEIPHGFIIIHNKLYFYRENERNYLGSVVKEKHLFPIKENITVDAIERLMLEHAVNELAVERKYLPEIFSADLLVISEDGLPSLKRSIIIELKMRNIITELYGNVIKFSKERRDYQH
ncbi:MAG: hypothetical protein ACFE9T_16050 [Promethearchaeota archaeon]